MSHCKKCGKIPYRNTLKDINKTIGICKNNLTMSIAANRDVLWTLLSLSVKCGKIIDFNKALPLSPIPLSLCNADGTKQSNTNSQLFRIILHRRSTEVPPQTSNQKTVYVLDMIALLRTGIPETFEGFAWKMVKSIPWEYRRVDIVADSYHEHSIKSSERKRRGSSTKIIVKSSKSKVPPHDRHRSIINKTFKYKVLNALQTTKLIISGDNFDGQH